MTIDARREFADSVNGKRWHNATTENWFREGLRLALQTMPAPRAGTTEEAAANWWKNQGAKQLADHILTLTELPKSKELDKTANLKQT